MNKRLIPLAAACLMASAALTAQTQAGSETTAPPPKFVLSFQPLGFIQAGPIVEGEYALGPKAAASAHLRFHALGAMSYLLAELEDDDTIDVTSLYYGLGIRGYPFSNWGERQGFYVGGLLELGSHSGLYSQGDPWEKRYETRDLVIVCDLGRRWFFGDFALSVGAYLGVISNLSYEKRYTDSSYSAEVVKESGDITPIGMATLSLGFGL